MSEGLNIADILIIAALGVFIYSRFMGNKLPKDTSKKSSDSKSKTAKVLDFNKAEKVSVKPKKAVNADKFKDLKGIDQIKAIDPSFDEKEFISGATSAYEFYYEAITNGDDEMLESMLAPRLYDEVMEKIETTEAKGENWQIDVQSIGKAYIVDAHTHGRTAIIDVKYTAEQTEYITNEKGDEIEGNSQKFKPVTTIWTWARPIDADDMNWDLEKISPVS